MVEDHNGERRWTFRDPSDRIVREYVEIDDAWKHERDFIHGPSGLIATRRHNGMVRYFHADHLGTPRLYTATDGKVFSRKDYYPFGAEIEGASAVLLDGFEDGDTRYWLESKDERRVEWTGHDTYYNERTRRSFNVHQESGHHSGKPHVDVRRRGKYPERKYDLKQEEGS